MGKMLERIRKKLDAIEEKISKKSAFVQSKIRTQRVDVITPTGELTKMKSSWIRSFAYDNKTQTLYMTTHKGKTYSWNNVLPDLAWNIVRGNAECTTDDKKKRWWEGKSPSLGAAYWQYLVASFGRSNAKSPQGASYFDLMNDVEYNPKAKYVKEMAGRPTKEMDKWKRFSRLQKYKKDGVKT